MTRTPDARLEYPEYPERATTECVVNALMHRDYLELGSEVHVEIYIVSRRRKGDATFLSRRTKSTKTPVCTYSAFSRIWQCMENMHTWTDKENDNESDKETDNEKLVLWPCQI